MYVTYPNGRRGLLYRKDYVCQHSAFNKDHPKPKSLLELRTALLAEWTHMTQNRIADLITSMHNRCQSVIADTGHHTRY